MSGAARSTRAWNSTAWDGRLRKTTRFLVDREHRRNGVPIMHFRQGSGVTVEAAPVVNFRALSTWFGPLCIE
ncbi:MAG: hypothetical protein M1162_01515 [Candidatus Thermoplasmatota archaeon]|nr:hypothetical protein [Candidatus Thermoplasmatota archaeon]